MTEEEKLEMMKKIKKIIVKAFCNTVKVTMDESEKLLNQVVSDNNEKHEDS